MIGRDAMIKISNSSGFIPQEDEDENVRKKYLYHKPI